MSESTEQAREIRLLSALDIDVRKRAANRLAEIGNLEAHFALQHRKLFERDRTTREVIHRSIEHLEERLTRQRTQSLRQGMPAGVQQILNSESPEPAARTAALSTQAFVQSLSTVPRQPYVSRGVLPLPEGLPELIEALRYPLEESRRRVEGALLLRGSEAVEPLRQAFARSTPIHKGRIAGVLAGIGDVTALPTLWTAWRSGMEGEAHVSLKVALLRMGAQLTVNPQKVSLQELLPILTESREHLPGLAEFIAMALEAYARQCPSPELRRAIPLLKGTWLHRAPAAMDRARRTIEAATAAWANLPIAAMEPSAVADQLPVPATSEASDSAVNLPRPGEVSP